MKSRILVVLILICLSCKKTEENKPDKLKSDRFELLPEPDKVEREKYLKNKNLTSFLENPIDLQEFKKKKGMRFTSSVTNGTQYYFIPKIKDSTFYTYYYPAENFTDSKRIDQIIVFKYEKNKHSYDDNTEMLIELRIFNKDGKLGKANLVGLTKTELESKFGDNYLAVDDGIIYSNNNKVLILELNNSKVKSYRYIKLNSNKIDTELINQITKKSTS